MDSISGSMRKNMLSQSFNLRAEVAAALLEREEDMKLYDAEAGSALSPPFSAVYRVLDMNTPQTASTGAAGSTRPARRTSTASFATPAGAPMVGSAGRERKPHVEIYSGSSADVPRQPQLFEQQPVVAVPESPVSGLVTASRPRRLSGSLTSPAMSNAQLSTENISSSPKTTTTTTMNMNNNTTASASATKKRLRRVSMPTTSMEFMEEEEIHPSSAAPAVVNDLHEEVVEDVAQHLKLVPSLHTQWARWRLYRVAEEQHEQERKESMSRALTSWQHEAQVNSAAVSRGGGSGSPSRFSRKAVRRLVKLRIEYGREVDTARWRLSSWSWFTKQRSLRRKTVDMLARRAAAKQVRRLFTRWRKETTDERVLRGVLATKRSDRARRCIRLWKEYSMRNLNQLLCLEWLTQHKLRARLRRCFESWRHESQMTSMRTDFLFSKASSSLSISTGNAGTAAGGAGTHVSAASAFHMSMFTVLRTWRANARYQGRVLSALSCLQSLRSLRSLRSVLLTWRATAFGDKSERFAGSVRLLERELADKCSMIVDRKRTFESQEKVWDSERRGYEERLRSMQLTNENLMNDALMQKATVVDGSEREDALRKECERMRSELARMSSEKEGLVAELEKAARRGADFEQKWMKEETKVAVETQRCDNLVHELDVMRSRLENEEKQSALALERSNEMQHLLETESKRNADLVEAVRKTEEKLRDAEREKSDEQRRVEETEKRLEDSAKSNLRLEASIEEKENGLSATNAEVESLKEQLAAGRVREQETQVLLSATSDKVSRLDEAIRSLEGEKDALAKANAELELEKTRSNLVERKLEEVVKHKEADIGELQERAGTDESKIRKLLITVTELRETVTALKADLVAKDEVGNSLAAAREQVNSLREEVRTRDENISDQRRDSAKLRNELMESVSKGEALAAELSRLRSQYEADKDDSQDSIDRLTSELSGLKSSFTDLKDEKTKVDMKLHETETRLRSAEDMMVQDETLLHDTKSELLDVKQMLDSAESERTIKVNEVDKLREETVKLASMCEKHRQAELETTLQLQNVIAEKAVLEQGHQIELGKMAELRRDYNAKIMELTTQQTLAEESKMRAEANATSLAKVREKLVHEEKAHNDMIALLSQEKDSLLLQQADDRATIKALQAEAASSRSSGGVHSPMTPSIIKRQQDEIAILQQTIKESNQTISELRKTRDNRNSSAPVPDGASSGASSSSGGGRKRNASGRKKSVDDEKIQRALSDAQSLSRDVKSMQ